MFEAHSLLTVVGLSLDSPLGAHGEQAASKPLRRAAVSLPSADHQVLALRGHRLRLLHRARTASHLALHRDRPGVLAVGELVERVVGWLSSRVSQQLLLRVL